MEERKKYRTDFLFSDSSFVVGAGSAFNLAGNYYDYNVSETPEKADVKAIQNDWNMIGEDLKIAFLEQVLNKIRLTATENESEKETTSSK